MVQKKELSMEYYHLKDREWQYILSELQTVSYMRLKNLDKLRQFLEAVYYVLRSGIQWRLLPYYYGNWRSVHNRFKRWCDKGIWNKLFMNSIQDADLTEVMLDGTIVRSHACSAGYGKNAQEEQALGRSKGGFTTKIHAMVDGLGNPLKFTLTGGNRHEIIKSEELISNVSNTNVIADKAYDSDRFRKVIEKKNSTHTIPPRKNRKEQHEYDKEVYKERHLIECFFGKLKQFRRVFSRSDKIKHTFQAFIDFASTLINLR